MAPGPNDFHFENGVQMPGLGADEPSERLRSAVAASVAEEDARLAAIERAEQENDERAASIDAKMVELEAREAALAAREAAVTGAAGAAGAAGSAGAARRGAAKPTDPPTT